MAIVDNKEILDEAVRKLKDIDEIRKMPLIKEPFEKDLAYRLCWSSNAIEGNTLTLDETISVIEYDEVKSGHSFTEYDEARRLYSAIKELLTFEKTQITEGWIIKANLLITGSDGAYRERNVYIGTLAEAIFYPPDHTEVPDRMKTYVESVNFAEEDLRAAITEVARQHIIFERIHPFADGNGRTGRLILNQQMINQGLLPLSIEKQSKYRQAFRVYERNGDSSMMVRLLCNAELESVNRILVLYENLQRSTIKNK